MNTNLPGDADIPKATRPSWTDLGPRIISALVLVAMFAVAIYFGGYVFAILAGIVFALTYREWERMVTLRPLTVLGMILIALVALAASIFPAFGIAGTAITIAVAAVIAGIAGGRDAAAWRVGGLIYFGLVIIAVLGMRGAGTAGLYAGWFLGITVVCNDTGAYFVGRVVGGQKLAPDISPAKTWSGAIGGWVLGTLAGTAFWLIFISSPWWIGLVLAAATGLAGQIGDLTESAVKRRFRVKDSGDIVPGHGGLMDRLDSLTFGALFLFFVGALHGGFGDLASGLLYW